MKAKEFVLLHHQSAESEKQPEFKTYRIKTESSMFFATGNTESNAWVNAKNRIIDELTTINLQKLCDDFNKKFPIGTAVKLKKDFVDELVVTKVKGNARIMGQTPVAWFENISGAYDINCVKMIVD